MLKTGDCVVKHAGTYTTGLGMVVSLMFVLSKKCLFVFFICNLYVYRLCVCVSICVCLSVSMSVYVSMSMFSTHIFIQ